MKEIAPKTWYAVFSHYFDEIARDRRLLVEEVREIADEKTKEYFTKTYGQWRLNDG